MREEGQHPQHQGWPMEGIRPACPCPISESHSGANPSLCHFRGAEVPHYGLHPSPFLLETAGTLLVLARGGNRR